MKKSHIFSTSFKEGIFLILPVGLTFWVINWGWNFLRNLVPSNLIKIFPETWNQFPYFNFIFDFLFLVVVLLLIIFFGMIASTVLGKFVHSLTEKILTKPTMIRPIYQTFKKVSEVIFNKNNNEDELSKRLSQSIIVPYPNAQIKSIGFVTAENADIFLGPEKGKDWLTVYVPSAPLVSAGFFLLCRKDDTDICLLSSGQAMTTIISVGTNTYDSISLNSEAAPPLKEKNIIKTWFFNGMVFVAPFIGTISILTWFFNFLYTSIRNITTHFPYFSSTLPIEYQELIFNVFLMVLMLLGIMILGFLGESAIGFGIRKMIKTTLESIPMLSSVYKIISKITEMFSPDPTKQNKFNQAVLVPYPTEKTYAVGFITGKDTMHIKQVDQYQVPVFIPTTPIPTTGWFIFANKKDLISLNMPIEKAFALVISAGILSDE
ncbi:MAG: DUF502 domain-containing protein [Brevinema sp.]